MRRPISFRNENDRDGLVVVIGDGRQFDIALSYMPHGVFALDEGVAISKADAEATEAKWLPIFPVGVKKHRGDFPGGAIDFTRGFFERMLANWTAAGRPAKPINYFHRGTTEYGDVTPIEQKVAAGWMSDFKLDADAQGKEWLWALTTWTPKARGHILADELRYLSPEFSVDGLNKATGKGQGPTLHGAALLNDPYLEELPRVAAANNPHAAGAAEMTMDWKKLLIAALALAENATDDEIAKALEAQKVKLGNLDAEVKSLTAKLSDANGKLDLANKGSTEMVQLRAANETLQQQVKLANERIAAIETERKNAEIDTYLAERVKAGVLTPAMTPGVKALAESAGLPAVKAIYDNAPVVQALGEKGRTGDTGALDADKAHGEFVALMDKMEKDGIDPSAAFTRIIRDRPDLAKFAGKLSH